MRFITPCQELVFIEQFLIFEVIYQTRGRVFHLISKHRKMVEKKRRS